MNVTIEIFIDGRWQKAGEFSPDEKSIKRGIGCGGTFEYDIDYTVEQLENRPDHRVGLCYPVSFELFRSPRWPAFLLDIMPAGAGRRVWLRRLGIADGAEADWELLRKGAGNPPGNIRIAGAALPTGPPHPGFSREEIVEKNADFIEYAEERGAVVAGATDVQGDAPKFLLVRDHNLRWHPDGALPDNEIHDFWIVKFPRGRTDADRTVLRNELPYLEVARRFGLRVGAPLELIDDALFIPRFDRMVARGSVRRHGLESLCSAAGIAEYGRRGNHTEFCAAIARHVVDLKTEIIEYIRRDILNAALRNTDNHGRNSAFLKHEDGSVALSPLYDFAPMFLDPEGIPRSSRWEGELEPVIGRPSWGLIAKLFASVVTPGELRSVLSRDAAAVARLAETMKECGVEDQVIERVAYRCAEIAADLLQIKG
ncbi:MAG: HipA domain-containing protein [Desulfuromonadaceae bacterium]|nr:HipA domain-containing protein [Desulfuromonadaceae bacterium]